MDPSVYFIASSKASPVNKVSTISNKEITQSSCGGLGNIQIMPVIHKYFPRKKYHSRYFMEKGL